MLFHIHIHVNPALQFLCRLLVCLLLLHVVLVVVMLMMVVGKVSMWLVSVRLLVAMLEMSGLLSGREVLMLPKAGVIVYVVIRV